MGVFHLARPQGASSALVIGTVSHTIFKPRHMIDELAQALVGVVLMALLPSMRACADAELLRSTRDRAPLRSLGSRSSRTSAAAPTAALAC